MSTITVRLSSEDIAAHIWNSDALLDAVLFPGRPDPDARWEDAAPAARIGLRGMVNALINDPELGARDVHEHWLRERREQGWVLGGVRDPVAKTSPDLIEWDDLDVVAKVKSDLTVAIVRALTPLVSMT